MKILWRNWTYSEAGKKDGCLHDAVKNLSADGFPGKAVIDVFEGAESYKKQYSTPNIFFTIPVLYVC